MKTLGIIGFGSFGQFISLHLSSYFDVLAYNRSDKSAEAKALNVKYCSLAEVCQSTL